MLLGVSTETLPRSDRPHGAFKLYVVKCDLQTSSKCKDTWLVRRGSGKSHSCKPCHNAFIAAKGGAKGGPVSGRNAVKSGQFLKCLTLAHTPGAYEKGRVTRELKGVSAFTSKPEQVFYEECLKRYGRVDRWKFLKVTGNHSCLDLYIPSCGVYIEVDGVYWHGLDRPYAQLEDRIKQKYNRDRALDAACSMGGIKLLRITDKQVLTGDWDWLFTVIDEAIDFGEWPKPQAEK